MADDLARAKLARAAAQLNAAARLRRDLPPLVLMTDDERLSDPYAAIESLPRGSLAIIRARDPQRRLVLARAAAWIAKSRSLVWLVADDPDMASLLRADGAHFPECCAAYAARWRARRPSWLITCAAHSLASCAGAARWGVDAVLLAPAFPTASHPGKATLGPLRLRFIAATSPISVYALGGIDAQAAMRLREAPLAGLAAVGALAVNPLRHQHAPAATVA